MSDSRVGDFGPGLRPVEVLSLAYLGTAALAVLLFGRGLGDRAEHVATYLGLMVAVGAMARFGATLPAALAWLRRSFFLLGLGWLYRETAYLNDLFWPQRYFDTTIISIERALFGADVSQVWSRAWPWAWWSETVHFAYFAYYFLGVVLFFALARRRRWDLLEQYLTVLALVFLGCQMWFIAFPVAGPYQHWGALEPAAPGGLFVPLVHRVIASGSSVGTAFPSSHVAVAGAVLGAAWVSDRATKWILVVIVPLLAAGAVYGGFHYLTDAIAGALWCAMLVPLGLAFHRRLRPVGPAEDATS